MIFSGRLISNKITMRGYMILTSTGCTIIVITELAVKNGLGSSLN
jgi:hypothetical protein